jgi:hypothetical protein
MPFAVRADIPHLWIRADMRCDAASILPEPYRNQVLQEGRSILHELVITANGDGSILSLVQLHHRYAATLQTPTSHFAAERNMTLPAGVIGFSLLQTQLFARPIPRDVVFLLNLFSSRLLSFSHGDFF